MDKQTKHKIIWISNRVNGVDESTKRRFSYSEELKALTSQQRHLIWKTQIKSKKVNFLDENDIEVLNRKYQVNAGAIALSLADIKAMKLKTNLEKKKLLGDLLGRHESFVMGGEMTKMMSVESYSLDVLNTDIDMRFIMENSRKFLGQMESGQLNKYGFSNLNILLQGPPGTGKTEFVKHYAETLQKELIIKRLSDIRSKWYGESLQNIAHMFEDAQSRNSILFLDEADAFFRNRETANEHYVAETNELLTRMENFKGILVCSTNFYQQMDPATMRRFSYKVRFDYLNEKGKLILFDKVLGELLESPVQEEDLRKLRSLPNLTPGDFKVVFQKNFLMGKRSGTDLIAQLQTEIAYKKDRANIGLA